ncbi:MAG: hypothetical protein QM783_03080 [Phycisphaerales bacterium]
MRTQALSLVLLAAVPALARASEAFPAPDMHLDMADAMAHAGQPPAEQPAAGSGGGATTAAPQPGRHTWELPPVKVEGEQAAPGLKEEELIGSYGQPRWTADRRFPTTRVYVIPEGKVEVEAWARATMKRADQGGETEWRFLQEVEIGLPNRFQLDLYLRQDYDTASDDTLFGGQFEVRWALADWGKLWGNPTLYLEYIVLEDRPQKIEPKLLLGGEIDSAWHWGANFVLEFELGGEEREHEYAVTTGISRTIVDEKLSIGAESVLSLTDVKGHRGDMATSLVIGPDLQWRPVPNLTVNFAPLIGVTNESPAAQIYLNVGWEF